MTTRFDSGPVGREYYTLFETVIGPCGIAWSDLGITRLQLPEADHQSTENRLCVGRTPVGAGLTSSVAAQVITDMERYLSGIRVDFSGIVLDLSGVPPFFRKIYEAARSVGWGETTTYGVLARRLGAPGAARAVGQAMARNPVAIIIPCHRVLASGNRVGGFSAFGGTFAKEHLLALEGVSLNVSKATQPALPFGLR